MRRIPLLLPLVLVACGSGPPEVTFSAAGESATVGPTQYCDVLLTECTDDPDAVASLAVPPGTPVTIEVPKEISATPWQVAFRYTVDGDLRQGRTSVFAPGDRLDYVLQVPEGGRLQTAEVQEYGVPGGVDGQRTFRIRGAWVLSATGS